MYQTLDLIRYAILPGRPDYFQGSCSSMVFTFSPDMPCGHVKRASFSGCCACERQLVAKHCMSRSATAFGWPALEALSFIVRKGVGTTPYLKFPLQSICPTYSWYIRRLKTATGNTVVQDQPFSEFDFQSSNSSVRIYPQLQKPRCNS